MERLSGGVLRRRTIRSLKGLAFPFPFQCTTGLSEPNVPFGEEEVLEGVGELRPHGAKPAGGGVLPGHGQPDGQNLQQGRHGQLPGAL